MSSALERGRLERLQAQAEGLPHTLASLSSGQGPPACARDRQRVCRPAHPSRSQEGMQFVVQSWHRAAGICIPAPVTDLRPRREVAVVLHWAPRCSCLPFVCCAVLWTNLRMCLFMDGASPAEPHPEPGPLHWGVQSRGCNMWAHGDGAGMPLVPSVATPLCSSRGRWGGESIRLWLYCFCIGFWPVWGRAACAGWWCSFGIMMRAWHLHPSMPLAEQAAQCTPQAVRGGLLASLVWPVSNFMRAGDAAVATVGACAMICWGKGCCSRACIRPAGCLLPLQRPQGPHGHRPQGQPAPQREATVRDAAGELRGSWLKVAEILQSLPTDARACTQRGGNRSRRAAAA